MCTNGQKVPRETNRSFPRSLQKEALNVVLKGHNVLMTGQCGNVKRILTINTVEGSKLGAPSVPVRLVSPGS